MRTAVIHHTSIHLPTGGETQLLLAAAVDGQVMESTMVSPEALDSTVLDLFDRIYHQSTNPTAFHITNSTVRRMLIGSQGSFPNATFPSVVAGAMENTWAVCRGEMHRLRREATPPREPEVKRRRSLTIATDASMRRGHRESGLGFATSHGVVQGCARRDEDVLDAEMHAISWALSATSGLFRKVTVCTDSQWAVQAAEEGAFPNRGRANQMRTAIADFRVRTGADVTVQWVRGHAGDALNEAAHRAAVAARRCRQWGLPHSNSQSVFRSIEQELAAA